MPDPRCSLFDERLAEAPERVSVEAPEIRAAAEHCPDCRSRWEQYRVVEQATRLWTRGVPQVDLTEPILARWAFENRPGRPSVHDPGMDRPRTPAAIPAGRRRASLSGSTRSRSWAVVAVAAAAALVLVPLLLQPPVEQEGEPVAFDAGETDRMDAVPEASASVELASVIRETGAAWRRLATDTHSVFSAFEARAALSGPLLAALPEDVDAGQELPRSSWVETLRQDFAPIGDDVRQAVGFLLDAVPLQPETI